MKTPRRHIARIISAKTLKSGMTKKLANEIAAYLLAERRVNELDSVMRDVQSDWAEAGIVEVTATSAHDLPAAAKSEITKRSKQIYPSASKIIITEAREPEVIGGVQLSWPNQQLDFSIVAKINKFKQLTSTGKE